MNEEVRESAMMGTTAIARYEHDCDRCVYLGQHGEADLYYCTQGGFAPTVIARRSDEGSDYVSGMAGSDYALVEARERARSRGLLAPASAPAISRSTSAVIREAMGES